MSSFRESYTSIPFPPGVREFYAGKHVIAHDPLKQELYILGNNPYTTIKNIQNVIFVGGKSKDVIITNNNQIHILENNNLRSWNPMKDLIAEAHLSMDRNLVVVTDLKACEFDILNNTKEPCPTAVYDLTNDARTAIKGNYLYSWTRYSLYKSRLGGVTNPSDLSKTPLNDSLGNNDQIVFATYNAMVVQGSDQVKVYDATGQVIYQVQTQSKVRQVKNMMGCGCAFFVDEMLYFLRSHRIVSVKCPITFRKTVFFLESEGYYLNDNRIETIQEGKEIHVNTAKQVVVSQKLPWIYVHKDLRNSSLVIWKSPEVAINPVTNALIRFTKRGIIPLWFNNFKPLVYQIKEITYVWTLNYKDNLEMIRYAIKKDGTVYVLDSVKHPNHDPKTDDKFMGWFYSRGHVFFQNGNEIQIYDGDSRKLLGLAKIDDAIAGKAVQAVHAATINNSKIIWLVLGKGKGTQITDVARYDEISRKFWKVNLPSLVITSAFTAPDGTLVLHSQTSKQAALIDPTGASTTIETDIHAAYQKEDVLFCLKYYKITAIVYRVYTPVGSKKVMLEHLGTADSFIRDEIRDFYVKNNKYWIVLGTSSVLEYSNQEVKLIEMPKGEWNLFTPKSVLDPEEKTILLYDDKVMYHFDELKVRDKDRGALVTGHKIPSQKGLSNTVVLAPNQLLQPIVISKDDEDGFNLPYFERSFVTFIV